MTTVVYLVRSGDDNEELRYSLRSLVNLPHDRVVIVGHRPAWVRGVEHVEGNAQPTKWLNVFDNLRRACKVADQFVVMNDDIFLMQPFDEAPSWVRGTLGAHLSRVRTGEWRQSLERTLIHLRTLGIREPLSYEIHAPVLMEGDRLERVLAPVAHFANPPQWRTLYGNIYAVPASEVKDYKISRASTVVDRAWPVVSTDDATWRSHPAAAAVRAAFPTPGPYER